MNKLTPVLPVERIEECLPFWTERLGFQVTGEVPEGDHLAFVMMSNGAVEVMLQTRESIEKDVPGLLPAGQSAMAFLYIEVPDVHTYLPKLEGCEVVLPLRRAFYGMEEVGVREPAGNIVTLAAKIPS